MRKHPFSKLLTHVLTVMGVIALSAGLALASVDSSTAGSPALLKAVTASTDGYTVNIVADRPLTFTYYKTANPFRAVIDLAQADAGSIQKNVEVNAGSIKRINVTKHMFGAGFLSRIEIVLSADEEFSVTPDPVDKGRLVVEFVKPQPVQPVAQEDKKQLDVKAPSTEPTTLASSPATPVASVEPSAAPPQEVSAPTEKQSSMPQDAPVSATTPPSTTRSEESVAAEITAIEAVNDSIDIKIKGEVVSFKSFRMNKPDRVIIDVFGAKSALKTQSIDMKNAFGVGKVRIGISPDKVRLVFDSSKDRIAPTQVVTSETGIKVVFAADEKAKDDSSKAASLPDTSVKQPLSKTTGVVEAIDFEVKGDNSLIAVTVSGNCEPRMPVKVAKGMTLTFKNCQIPRNLQRFIDTGSFPSVVKGITPTTVKKKNFQDAKLLVQLRADAPSKVTAVGKSFVWEIKNSELPQPKVENTSPEVINAPAKPQKQQGEEVLANDIAGESGVDIPGDTSSTFNPSKAHKKKYTGRKVSLEFSDAEVRRIFQLIAEVSNLNFLIADDVTGTISIKLVNVPWDQALDVILESKSLEMKREGNIVQIKPKGKFKNAQQEDLEVKRAQDRALPLVTEIFDVNFADISEVQSQFDRIKSERGIINKDTRTNRVIVKDIQPALDEMKFLLKNVDMPEKQVLIEARIVEATSTFTRDLGVQWGFHYRDADAPVMGVRSMDTGWGGVIGITPPIAGFNPAGVAGAAVGVSFGKLTDNIQLDLRLSAAANAGLVKIISSPKVVTLNNKQATISQGQTIYLPSTSAEGTTQTPIQATLSLEVTPHITPDGTVLMKILAKNDAPGTAPPGASAAVNKKEAKTELLVKNGETTVIGGIYVDSDQESDSGVPYLMDIPLLGALFKSNSKVKTKTELLIFITPRIINN